MSTIILSGCSYIETALPSIEPTEIPKPLQREEWWIGKYSSEPNVKYFLKSKYNKEVHDMSIRGASHDSIFRRVYEYINYTKCIDNKFVVQLTHLHRIGLQHSNPNCWIDFQAASIDTNSRKYGIQPSDIFFSSIHETGLPILKTQKILQTPNDTVSYNLYDKFYKTYLENFYDDDSAELDLIYKIKLLKAYVESTKNKIIFVGFPTYKNKTINDYLIKIDDDEKSFLKYAYSNDMISFEGHLNEIGSELFSDLIIKNFNL